jgi:hypothetical protein
MPHLVDLMNIEYFPPPLLALQQPIRVAIRPAGEIGTGQDAQQQRNQAARLHQAEGGGNAGCGACE